MSGWFSKAANGFKPEVKPDAPLPFILFCNCGEEQRGWRRPHHQRIVCKVCGTPLFILPRDAYPAPQPVPAKKVVEHEPVSDAVLADDEISMIEDLEPEEISVPASRPSRKKKGAEEHLPTLAELRQRIRDAEKPRPPKPVAAAEPEKATYLENVGTAIGELGTGARKEFVRFWTPFRILAAVVMLVMLFTAGWTVRQSLLASAVKVAQRESELGLKAVQDEDWTVAKDHLQLAVAALDRLGRTDPDAQTVRQYARETQAQFRLCDISLEELLSKAQMELAARDQKDQIKNHLAAGYRGDWMLFEGTVEDIAPEKSRRRAFAIRLPVNPAGTGGEVTISVNFPVFDQLIPKGEEKQVIVAGAITDCEQDDEGNWIVTLDPKTGFLWTHLNTYRAIGFGFNPLRTQKTVEVELNEQAQATGVPP